MPELKRDNGSIYYEVSGDGPPLVCLRGLGRSIRHWLGYDQDLAKHFRVLAIDMRGMGRTTVPHSITDSMYDLAGDVVDVMTEVGFDQTHVMGVSLGGMVTLAMGRLSQPHASAHRSAFPQYESAHQMYLTNG